MLCIYWMHQRIKILIFTSLCPLSSCILMKILCDIPWPRPPTCQPIKGVLSVPGFFCFCFFFKLYKPSPCTLGGFNSEWHTFLTMIDAPWDTFQSDNSSLSRPAQRALAKTSEHLALLCTAQSNGNMNSILLQLTSQWSRWGWNIDFKTAVWYSGLW